MKLLTRELVLEQRRKAPQGSPVLHVIAFECLYKIREVAIFIREMTIYRICMI